MPAAAHTAPVRTVPSDAGFPRRPARASRRASYASLHQPTESWPVSTAAVTSAAWAPSSPGADGEGAGERGHRERRPRVARQGEPDERPPPHRPRRARDPHARGGFRCGRAGRAHPVRGVHRAIVGARRPVKAATGRVVCTDSGCFVGRMGA
ncbi:hypothetical protein SCALM49S_04887 [Streptomyces californicus]